MQHGEMMVRCFKVKQTQTKKTLVQEKQEMHAHKQKKSYKEKQN
jgi:hypothetical protein